MIKIHHHLLLLICFVSLIIQGCTRGTGKNEKREIAKERKEITKSTSDLSEAVRSMDALAWDSVSDYEHFRKNSLVRLSNNEIMLDSFIARVSWNHRTPIIYQRRIKIMRRTDSLLKSRLENYNLYGKSNWEDFKKLFDYDLKSNEAKIYKLTKKDKER